MDEARKEGGKIILEKYKQRMSLVQKEKAALIAKQSEPLEAEAKRLNYNKISRLVWSFDVFGANRISN